MFTHSHRVRYHEADGQGYLYNARHLEIVDVAFTEFLRAIGSDFKSTESKFDPTIVTAQLDFHSPARFDEVLDVGVTCTYVGNSSVKMRYATSSAGRPIHTIDIVYVNVDAPAGKSRPIPPTMADALRAHRTVDE